jgi:hypothetical protein
MAGENINRRLNIYINDKEVVNSMRGVTSAMVQVKNQMRGLDKTAEDYDAQLEKLKKTYERLKNEQSKFRADMAENKSMLDRMKSSLGPISIGMLKAFSIQALMSGFMNKMRQGWQTIVDFDQKQADLAATLGKTRAQITGLTLDAIKIGASTAYSATEVSVLQNELAKLGKTSTEIKAMTKDVLNAATALETDLGSAAVLVGGQLNSYGESADQAGKYSDIMANSVNISATSYDYLSTALPKVSAVAAQAGVPFERLNAILGVTADQNIAAETAGTGFRNILLESAKAGKSYQSMLDEVKNSANQGKKAVELFGKENATVAVILANSTDKIKANTEALENSAGSAEKLAREKMNSIKGSIEGFSGAWEGFLLSMEKGDGIIARSIRGIIDLGTGFLQLITPMKTVSEQIEEEQMGLNLLVGKITSTNIKNEDRKKLLIDLKNQYPDFIKNINIETISNGELNSSLAKINEQYVKRIALQKQVENVEEAANDEGETMQQKLKAQEALFKKLTALSLKYKLNIPIDFGDLEQSAKKVKAAMAKVKSETSVVSRMFSSGGLMGEEKGIDSLLERIKTFDRITKDKKKVTDEETEALNRQKEALGLNTEAENENIKAKEAALAAMKQLRLEAQKLGMKTAMTAPDQDVRIWMNAYKERMAASSEMSEEEKKKREREAKEAKKHAEDLVKQEEELQKRLLELQRNGQDLKINLISDKYDKERAAINVEYDRKIEDAKNNILKEEAAIAKLRAAIADPKTPKGDKDSFKKQLQDHLSILAAYNDSFIELDRTRNLKLLTVQEKYMADVFKKEQEAATQQLNNLKTKQNNELAEITTLQKAKEYLAAYQSEEELRHVKTLEEARKAIKEEHLKEQYELEAENLKKIMSMYQLFLDADWSSGFELLTEDQRKEMMEFLDQLELKLSGIKNNQAEADDDDDDKKGKKTSSIDILGKSYDEWNEIFENLDTFEGKLEAVSAVAGVIQNAFATYFKFMEANENRQLSNFIKSTDKKKKALADQLERGYISQESYNAQVASLDEQVARKKAEMEYKQAKRQKAMGIADAAIKTALAIIQCYSQLGPIAGTVAAVLVGAVGAFQIATIAKQPLPDQNGGYKQGGYTGDGDIDEVAGDVHRGEYVIPNKVLFDDDPLMPNIMNYLETKRNNRRPTGLTNDDPKPASGSGGGSATDLALMGAMNRLSNILERLETEGLQAWLVNDIPLAKKIDQKIKELKKLEAESKTLG